MFDRNHLFYGDNLDFIRDHSVFPSESVDLIYLDPPFNSNANYNVLFSETAGESSSAQIRAFDDTWAWDTSAAEALAFLMNDQHTPAAVVSLIKIFHQFLGHSPMLAYLVQMAVRLVHLRRILKPTGSLYLHCDPTASHYLKMVLDGVFQAKHFLNEIIWKRTHAHGSADRFGRVHDVIFLYGATESRLWAYPRIPHDPDYVETKFRWIDQKTSRRYQDVSLTGAGKSTGPSGKPWRRVNPTKVGRHWALPQKMLQHYSITGKTIQDKLDALDAAGLIHWPTKKGGVPRLKWFADALEGVAPTDVWIDIPPINSQAQERLGYPTQKTIDLLKRIIAASSSPGAVILDPVCGCGTTIDAVETISRENPDLAPRRWIGIDITHLAINLIKHRLARFDPSPVYEVVGEPKDLSGARQLFHDDPFQFQFWACGLVGARPAGATPAQPK